MSIHPEGQSCSDRRRVLVLNDLPDRPEYSSLPSVKKVKFAHQPYNNLRQRFPKISPAGGPCISDIGRGHY